MIKLIFLVLWLVLMLPAGAQIFPNLGGQRAGISALTFLKNDLSPRSSAMAGASVALPGDAFSMTVNPASGSACRLPVLALSSGRNATGLIQSYLGFCLPQKKNAGVWMASMNYLSSGLRERRTEFQPMGDGSLYASDAFKIGLGYSRALSKMFSCGMNLNLVREQLSQYQATAVTADLGFLYKTDWKDLSFAVGLQHFGGNSTGKGDFLAVKYNRAAVSTEAYGAPTLFSMGVSIIAWEAEKHRLLASAQLNHPNDNAENIRTGIQYSYDSLIHFRLGYKLNVAGEGISAGVGIRSRLGAFPLTIDYGIIPNRFLGMYHSLGISLGFIRTGNFDKPEKFPENTGNGSRADDRSIREKIQIDSISIRIIEKPDFKVDLPVEVKPVVLPLDLKPVAIKLPSEERPSALIITDKKPAISVQSGIRKRKAQIRTRRIPIPSDSSKSIWEKPYLKFWTEMQWKGFLNQRFQKEKSKP